MKKLRAFTLVELLIVVVIIGILATFVAISLLSARSKAADAKAKDSVSKVRDAVELVVSGSDNGIAALVNANCDITNGVVPKGAAITGGESSGSCNARFYDAGAAVFKSAAQDAKGENARVYSSDTAAGVWVIVGKASNYVNGTAVDAEKRCFYYNSNGGNNMGASKAGDNTCQGVY
ncbi:MAG: type II secretion system GspH family protein [Candidatus Berkelbacteria bacterium]|nr:type II secretion system GspH family protein [Candidatus Berkelbacteria bacterium]